jgi:hypothetical protein
MFGVPFECVPLERKEDKPAQVRWSGWKEGGCVKGGGDCSEGSGD